MRGEGGCLSCSSRKYPHFPLQKVSCFAPPGNSSLFSYIASKNVAFKTPLSLGISNDLPWGGYGFFLELQKFTCNIKSYCMIDIHFKYKLCLMLFKKIAKRLQFLKTQNKNHIQQNPAVTQTPKENKR